MSYKTTALPTENLNNITDEKMMEFAQAFNAIEPGGTDVAHNAMIATNFTQMIDFMDVISFVGILAAVTYLAAPYVRDFITRKLSGV